jgi:uncharacterized protein
MKDDLLKLLKAQQIDLDIDKIYKYKIEYPRQIAELKKEIVDLENSLKTIENTIVEKDLNKRNIEKEILAEKEIQNAKEKRLLETKTNKEYTAVQSEIQQTKNKIDSLENEELELITELDILQPKKDELNTIFKNTKTNNNLKIEEINNKFEMIETDIKNREHSRDKILKDISLRALTVYTRLRKGRGGLAVSTVDHLKHSCRGCYKQLPPQKVLEVRRGDKMIFCENCGRILVWEEENDNK